MNEFIANFSYASLASLLSAITSYPFDTLKSNMQNDNKKYKGFLRSAYIMYREFGIRGFYRGFYSDLGIMMVQNACPLLILLVPLEYIKVLQQCDQANREITDQSIHDKLRDKKQTFTKKNNLSSDYEKSLTKEIKSFLEIMQEVIKYRGYSGLFRGFWITFNRDFISGGVYFLMYYFCKRKSIENLNSESYFFSMVTFGLSGGIAGGISWLVTHPFDTIKTIIQMGDLKENTYKQKEVFDKLCKDGYLKGIMNSYRGGLPSFFSYIVGCSTFFVVYEKMKLNLN